MTKDNQLSTVLLLAALGFLIYYLTKPQVVVQEKFSNDPKSLISKQVVSPESETPPSENEPRNMVGSRNIVSKAIPEINPNILKQILAETNTQKPSIKTQPESETPKSETPTEIRGDQMDVFNFEPNDIQQTGASLEAAFERPVPSQSNTSVVDLNKNNVKNYNAKDFLPKEINDQWFDTDFSQAKVNINDDKLINTERYVIGINTVGQSLKNASYDIRGTVPNPKFTVSPWNNSTYEPDFNLKSLC